MRIWLTGSGGFVGSRLLLELRNNGYEVIAFARQARPGGDSREISIDLSGSSAAARLREAGNQFGYPDVVVHLAARQPGKFTFREYVSGNVMTTANLLDSLAEHPPARFIYGSTLSVYGKHPDPHVNELTPALTDHPYGVTKLAAEKLLSCHAHSSEIINLRLPSIYGFGHLDSFVDGLARIAKQGSVLELYNNGAILREALHVSDIISAIRLSLEASLSGSGLYTINIGNGKKYRVVDYAEALVKALDSKSRILAVDTEAKGSHALHTDISLAKEILNFSPTDLDTALGRYATEIKA